MEVGCWSNSRNYDELWPDEPMNLWKTKNQEGGLMWHWSGNRAEDYLTVADEYYHAGFKICEEVIQAGHDNAKDDTWFLAGLFMFQQSIELILKSKIYSTFKKTTQVQEIFVFAKHDVQKLYKASGISKSNNLTQNQKRWINDYLCDLENWDRQSTLFRYPLEPMFFKKDPPKFVDVYWTAEKMNIAYSMLRCSFQEAPEFRTGIPDELPEAVFFTAAKNGIGNCYLEGMSHRKTFHLVIQGYLSVSEFLLNSEPITQNRRKLHPELFSLRHLIELELKQVASSRFYPVRNLKISPGTHLLFKGLWKKLYPVLEKYSGSYDQNGVLENVDSFMKQLQSLDKNGDFFRYPTGFNHEYYLLPQSLDVFNMLDCIRAICNMLEGYDMMFDEFAEHENMNL